MPLQRALVLVVLSVTFVRAEPLILSYKRFQDNPRVAQVHAGRLLLEELNCSACHDQEAAALQPKQAPLLAHVAGRVRPDYLLRFLADPAHVKPGTTMPNLFKGVAKDRREEQVKALVHYLYSNHPGEPAQDYATFGAGQRGNAKFHSVGCVACHGPSTRETDAWQPLGALEEKYTLPSLTAFLKNPQHVRPSGRMPSMNLSADDARDIAAYLLPNVPERPGIEYRYYEIKRTNRLPDFDKIEVHTEGTAQNFDPAKHAQRGDNFALQYRGEMMAEERGEYRFFLGSDDGSRLWIDDVLVVDNDGEHGMKRESGKALLEPGRHRIRLDYFEIGGGEELEVEFEGPNTPKGPLASALVAAIPQAELTQVGFELDPQLVAKGRALFATIGCASCHDVGVPLQNQFVAKPLADLSLGKGCLSPDDTAGVEYELSETQCDQLQETLTAGIQALTAKQSVHHTMLRFNCVGCHARDGLGGRAA